MLLSKLQAERFLVINKKVSFMLGVFNFLIAPLIIMATFDSRWGYVVASVFALFGIMTIVLDGEDSHIDNQAFFFRFSEEKLYYNTLEYKYRSIKEDELNRIVLDKCQSSEMIKMACHESQQFREMYDLHNYRIILKKVNLPFTIIWFLSKPLSLIILLFLVLFV